jgi:hypothetical protein
MTSEAESLVWYAVYGSNLAKDRFKCYLKGKAPGPGARIPKRCPVGIGIKGDRQFLLHHELYFAKRASNWNHQGVAFVRTEGSVSASTLCRRYLLTLDQFRHVAREENGGYETKPVHINEKMLSGRPSPIRRTGWYRILLPCGTDSGIPVVTLTGAIEEAGPFIRPSDAYMQTIRSGLHQKYHKLSDSEIDDYLQAATLRAGF